MAQNPVSIRVNRLHLAFVRRIDDTYIFSEQAIPLLNKARDELETSEYRQYGFYWVPDVKYRNSKFVKFANRTDTELKEIYDRFLSQEFYEILLVASVSKFESYLLEVLRIIISAYPQKLTLNVKGVEVSRDVPLNLLLNANDLTDVLSRVIEGRLIEISYAAPKDYLEYLQKISGVDTSDSNFLDYLEIKASRDLIVHNTGVINQTYISKAGVKKRGEIGERLNIDIEYFGNSMATLKRMSGIIQRDVTKTFG